MHDSMAQTMAQPAPRKPAAWLVAGGIVGAICTCVASLAVLFHVV